MRRRNSPSEADQDALEDHHCARCYAETGQFFYGDQHTIQPHFVCSKCGKVFSDQRIRDSHWNNHRQLEYMRAKAKFETEPENNPRVLKPKRMRIPSSTSILSIQDDPESEDVQILNSCKSKSISASISFTTPPYASSGLANWPGQITDIHDHLHDRNRLNLVATEPVASPVTSDHPDDNLEQLGTVQVVQLVPVEPQPAPVVLDHSDDHDQPDSEEVQILDAVPPSKPATRNWRTYHCLKCRISIPCRRRFSRHIEVRHPGDAEKDLLRKRYHCGKCTATFCREETFLEHQNRCGRQVKGGGKVLGLIELDDEPDDQVGELVKLDSGPETASSASPKPDVGPEDAQVDLEERDPDVQLDLELDPGLGSQPVLVDQVEPNLAQKTPDPLPSSTFSAALYTDDDDDDTGLGELDLDFVLQALADQVEPEPSPGQPDSGQPNESAKPEGTPLRFYKTTGNPKWVVDLLYRGDIFTRLETKNPGKLMSKRLIQQFGSKKRFLEHLVVGVRSLVRAGLGQVDPGDVQQPMPPEPSTSAPSVVRRKRSIRPPKDKSRRRRRREKLEPFEVQQDPVLTTTITLVRRKRTRPPKGKCSRRVDDQVDPSESEQNSTTEEQENQTETSTTSTSTSVTSTPLQPKGKGRRKRRRGGYFTNNPFILK